MASPSLFTISHNAESISVACSKPSSTKSSIFFSTLARVVSVVESSTHMWASCSMYRFLISSCLRLCWHVIDFGDTPNSPRCESAERFFNDVTLRQLAAYVVQGKGFQRGDIVLRGRLVRCQNAAKAGHRLCRRVDRWTLGTA